MYTADIVNVVEAAGLGCHLYADDIQIYRSGPPSSSTQISAAVSAAVDLVGRWMSLNKLKLNVKKTQYMWMGTSYGLSRIDEYKNPVSSLGVILDPHLSMENHISQLCQRCFYQLHRIRSIRRYLTVDSTRALVCSFVCGRIDYCNAIMYGINVSLRDNVQSVLNSAARLVAGYCRFDSISAYMRDDLHWLRMPERVVFKLALLARDCLAGDAPTYLKDQLQLVSGIANRSRLRSSDNGDLVLPKFNSSRFGKRRFSVSSAQIWNSLPLGLKRFGNISRQVFKKRLKHHLF